MLSFLLPFWSYVWVPQTVADFEWDFALAGQLGAKRLLLWKTDYTDDRAQAADLKAAMSRHARW